MPPSHTYTHTDEVRKDNNVMQVKTNCVFTSLLSFSLYLAHTFLATRFLSVGHTQPHAGPTWAERIQNWNTQTLRIKHSQIPQSQEPAPKYTHWQPSSTGTASLTLTHLPLYCTLMFTCKNSEAQCWGRGDFQPDAPQLRHGTQRAANLTQSYDLIK